MTRSKQGSGTGTFGQGRRALTLEDLRLALAAASSEAPGRASSTSREGVAGFVWDLSKRKAELQRDMRLVDQLIKDFRQEASAEERKLLDQSLSFLGKARGASTGIGNLRKILEKEVEYPWDSEEEEEEGKRDAGKEEEKRKRKREKEKERRKKKARTSHEEKGLDEKKDPPAGGAGGEIAVR